MKRRSSTSVAIARPWRCAAPAAQFRIPLDDARQARMARNWLLLGVAALGLSGVFSILLVLSRTPGIASLFPVADFFRTALVVHVDLSVLVWFIAFGGVFWTLAGSARGAPLGKAALVLAAIGTVLLCIAPFAERAVPVMANYVPVLDGPVFLSGLGLLAAAVVLLVARTLFYASPPGPRLDGASALRLGLTAGAFSAGVALFAFVWSWRALPGGLDPRTYYEVLFWGGGHVLQFTWTLLLLVAWLWLADAIGARLPLSPRVALALFALALLLVLATPVVYLAWDVTSVEHRRALTWMMRLGGGLAILPVALALLIGLSDARELHVRQRPLRAALVMSLVLFAAGGLIGFAISGANVKIPAHYHGCIVGITLAFMGVTYELLPRFGYRAPTSRLALWQPYLYGVGQLMHVGGLVWSGGHGVQRKVAGTEQVLGNVQQVAGMGLMGLGGLVAVIGGLLFIAVVWRSMSGARDARLATRQMGTT